MAKNFQFEMFQKFFMDEDIEVFVKDYIKRLESGEFDKLLFYKKRLSKDPKEYTKNIPPHVRAALMIDHNGPYRLKSVTYMMTKNGPIPKQNGPQDIDYTHYIEKQIRPLADVVLSTMGKSFDGLMLGDQLSLF